MTDRVVSPGRYKVPTIRDVAARAGVAPATVSNVITGRRRVAPHLRSQVLEAVEALGYRPNQVAASLRLQQTRTIGIVVPNLSNPFFADLVRRLEELAAKQAYQVLLVGTNETATQEGERISALLSRRIDGLIVSPTNDDTSAFSETGLGGPPVVLVDRGFGAENFDTVGADNVDAAYRGTRYLIQLGHRDIALIVIAGNLSNISERVDGYRQALAEAGLSARERVCAGGLTIDSCRAAVDGELARADRPTAIFGTGYAAVLGAIKAVQAVNLTIPHDISLLGFDDSDWMTVLRPYVSTLSQPVEAMAATAWKLLNARLAGDAADFQRVRLPCALEVRESTAPPVRLT
jgi:LacI family transcriptional regulator